MPRRRVAASHASGVDAASAPAAAHGSGAMKTLSKNPPMLGAGSAADLVDLEVQARRHRVGRCHARSREMNPLSDLGREDSAPPKCPPPASQVSTVQKPSWILSWPRFAGTKDWNSQSPPKRYVAPGKSRHTDLDESLPSPEARLVALMPAEPEFGLPSASPLSQNSPDPTLLQPSRLVSKVPFGIRFSRAHRA